MSQINITERERRREESELQREKEREMRLQIPLVERLRDCGPFRASDGYMSVMTGSWEDSHEAADEIDRLNMELIALRAVAKDGLNYLNRAVLSATFKEFNDSVLIAQDILNRGLKGSGG